MSAPEQGRLKLGQVTTRVGDNLLSRPNHPGTWACDRSASQYNYQPQIPLKMVLLLGDGDCKFAGIIIMFIYICFQRFIGTLIYNCGGSLLNIIVGCAKACRSLRVTGRDH